MKKFIFSLMLVLIMTLLPITAISETIDVLIKGVDDGVKTSKQQDYKEAVMNAKLEAIERAGVEIASVTKVVNFQIKFDMVESKAQAVLLPGFQIMDLGYQADGTYLVVLSGKIQVGETKKEKGKYWGKVRSKPIRIFENKSKWIWNSYSPSTIKNDYKDNGDGTVTDWATGLMWQKQASPNAIGCSNRAVRYIEELNGFRFAGYSDWRLPTLEELATIVELRAMSKGEDPEEKAVVYYIDQIFSPAQHSYWSSDLTENTFIVSTNTQKHCGGWGSRALRRYHVGIHKGFWLSSDYSIAYVWVKAVRSVE